jgi:hypothetical protein
MRPLLLLLPEVGEEDLGMAAREDPVVLGEVEEVPQAVLFLAVQAIPLPYPLPKEMLGVMV